MNRVIRVISFVLSVTLLFLAFSITASAIADSETGTYAGYSYCADVYAITGAYGSGFSYSGSTIISMVGSAKMSYGGSISSFPLSKKGYSDINISGSVPGYTPVSASCAYRIGSVQITTLPN